MQGSRISRKLFVSPPAASVGSLCTPLPGLVITFVLSAENELNIPYLAHRLLCVNCSLSEYYCAAIGDNCKAL